MVRMILFTDALMEEQIYSSKKTTYIESSSDYDA